MDPLKTPARTLRLRDGRTLAWSEFGDPTGRPLINQHGGLVSGLDVTPSQPSALDLGIRMISPDRPGIGASDPMPGRTMTDWTNDVAELADHLELDAFDIMGWSMGGQYALACAHAMPERVRSTTVIAGCLPLDDPGTFAELNALDRRFTRLARDHPRVLERIATGMAKVADHVPSVWNSITARGAAPLDARALRSIPGQGWAPYAVPALRHGRAVVEEYLAWIRPWGFTVADVPGRVEIWQGGADDLVPARWAVRMAEDIPGASLHLLPEEGHVLAYAHYRDIFEAILGGTPDPDRTPG